jgi:hypothetical protein
MSTVSRMFDCTPDDVFDVLADGWHYGMWVVGAARIRAVDETWPEPGSKIHHSVGVWPLLLDDESEVEEHRRPHELVLTVRAWPSGEGRVRITCEPVGAQTRVTIEEQAISGPALLVPRPVQDLTLKFRNIEALRRLSYLAEKKVA